MMESPLRVTRFSLFCISLLFAAGAGATFQQGLQKYSEGDFAGAYFIFKNLAEVGDKDAQYNLGVMHYRGEHLPRSKIDGYAWMKIAAEGGNEQYGNTATAILEALSEKGKEAARARFSELNGEFGDEVLSQALALKPLSDADCTQPPEKLSGQTPRYPSIAQRNGTSGYVDLNYNISRHGYARDISVLQQTDKQFARPAATALQQSRWQPALGDSANALQARGLMMRYKFFIEGFGEAIVKSLFKDAEPLRDAAERDDMLAQYKYAKHLEAIRAFEVLNQKVEYQDTNKWFYEAAKRGHPLAQYEIGKNMVAGRGCELDALAGMKWLRAAAASGHPFAQKEIAMSAVYDGLSVSKQATYWLRRAAASAYFQPKMILAWHLVNNPDATTEDIEEATELLESDPVVYFDEVRIFETRAAVSAAAGDFKQAMKWQTKALKQARSNGWEIPVMAERMSSYESGKRWFGRYHHQG